MTIDLNGSVRGKTNSPALYRRAFFFVVAGAIIAGEMLCARQIRANAKGEKPENVSQKIHDWMGLKDD